MAVAPSPRGTYVPSAPGKYRYGGTGGTSYEYAEPSYQVPVVPAAMADANMGVTGEANRVVPTSPWMPSLYRNAYRSHGDIP